MDDGNLTDSSAFCRRLFRGRRRRWNIPLFCGWLWLMVFIGGCSLPEAPGDLSWDAQFYVPLGVRTYSLNDLVDSSTVFLSDDSILYYAAFTEVKVPLSDSLAVGPVTDTLIKPPWVTDTTSLQALPVYRHRLLAATIASGTLWLSVENVSDVADTVYTTLPDIVNQQGDALVFVHYVAPHSRIDTTYNLANHVIRLEDTTPQLLETHLHATGPSEIHAYVRTDRFTFRYYTGVLDDLEMEALAGGQAVERPPEGWESVHPTAVDAHINVIRGVSGAVGDADLHFTTWDGNQTLASAYLAANGLHLDRDTSVVLSHLAYLMNIYPDSVSATGTITISGTVENVQPSDTVILEVEGRAYLSFTLDPVHAPTEVIRVETEDLKDVQSGSVRIRIWNRLPVGGRVFMVWDSDSTNVLDSSIANVDTVVDIQIPAPTIAGGRAQEETYTDTTLTLTNTLLEYFRHPPFFSRTDITLPGAGSDTLVAHASDYIKIQPIAEITYRIDTGDDQ
jgi:hypothetical protein